MRVRYGKPIKVRSLLGQSNIPFSYTYANVTFYPLTTGTFHYYAGPSVLNIKYVNRQANHKYFLFLNTDIVYSWSYFGIWDTYNTGYEGNRTAPIKDGNNYYTLISPTTSATNAVPSFQFGVTQNLPAIANYALIIDLTEIGLDNLTAQEFYNKYHQYFPLIATGEEITIDDKAGQVSYSSQKSLKSIVGKQVGLTADNSFNIYSVTSVATVALCNNKFGYSTVSDLASRFTNDDAIQIVEGHKYFVHVKVHNMLDRSAQRWMCMRFISTTGASYALSGNIYSYTWKFTTNTVSAILTGTTTGNLAYTYFGDFPDSLKMTIATEYPESYLIVDMTALGEDSLTVEEFYTKYKGYFSDLENGKQILVGKGKVAGGSSDIYYGYNQLAINGDFANGKSSWADWNSTTVVTNGIAEITRTNTSQSSLHQDIAANPGDKIYVRATMWSDGTTPVRLGLNGGISWSGTATTSTTPVLFEVIKPVVSTGNGCRIELFGTGVANTKYYAKEINAINLTTWFGAGKEPSTIEEFKEKFVKEYYGFCSTPIKLTRYQIEALPNYGYNQLTQRLTSPSYDVQGYHWEYGNDGWITFSGTPTGTTYFNPFYAQYIALNHKFYIKAEIASNTKNTAFQFGTLNSNIRLSNISSGINENIMTCNHEINSSIGLANFTKNVDIGTVRARFMLIDLTDWYGEGKEPATIEEFKQTFPNKYYPYSKKRLLNKYMINKLEN